MVHFSQWHSSSYSSTTPTHATGCGACAPGAICLLALQRAEISVLIADRCFPRHPIPPPISKDSLIFSFPFEPIFSNCNENHFKIRLWGVTHSLKATVLSFHDHLLDRLQFLPGLPPPLLSSFQAAIFLKGTNLRLSC